MSRRTCAVLVLFALLALATWGSAWAFGSSAGASAQATICPSNPLRGVYNPTRLQVLKACTTFVGTVRLAHERAADGDLTFDVVPDPAYASMLNAKNRSINGGIHMEIVPIDQTSCTSGCSGARVAAPARGEHVRLTGTWVLDRGHGWNEIHPTWRVERVSGGAPPPPPPPPPPTAQVARLKASLSGKGLRHGARRGHGKVVLRVDRKGVCWVFSRLGHVGTPTRAAIRWHERGRPGKTVLALGRRFKPSGCVAASPALFGAVTGETFEYYVLVASKRHRQGAVRGQLRRAS